MPVNSAVAPEPETGRSNPIGTNSTGNPTFSASGRISPARASSAPDARSVPTATNSAIIVGATNFTVAKPSLAPSMKLSKIFTRLNNP